MKSLHSFALLFALSLSACDAEKAPAPPPKVAAKPAAEAVAPASEPVVAKPAITANSTPAKEPVYQLAPNVPVVPVMAGGKSASTIAAQKAATPDKKTESLSARSAKVKVDNAEVARRAPVASKSKTPAQVVKDTRLPKAKLDLSLPPDMVKQLTPPKQVITAGSSTKPKQAGTKPLLPKMFPDSESEADFQLQGRLLSNEMDLQLRNDARKEVEGAALDFKFRQ